MERVSRSGICPHPTPHTTPLIFCKIPQCIFQGKEGGTSRDVSSAESTGLDLWVQLVARVIKMIGNTVKYSTFAHGLTAVTVTETEPGGQGSKTHIQLVRTQRSPGFPIGTLLFYNFQTQKRIVAERFLKNHISVEKKDLELRGTKMQSR
jgi:hypothetical protein